MNEIVNSAHKKAKKKAIKKLPELDLTIMLNLGVKVVTHELTLEDIVLQYGPKYKEAVAVYASCFGHDFIEKEIKSYLKDSDNEVLNKLGKGGFNKQLVKTTENIGKCVFDYYNGTIDEFELMNKLGDSGVKNVCKAFLEANEIDLNELSKTMNEVLNSSQMAIAYICFTEVYKILMDVLNDAAIQHQMMLEAEARSKESIKLIKQYRNQMNETVNTFFEKHYDTFNDGFKEIDKALLENDPDGYIMGNNEIQALLNYEIQFNNQEEFDDLMNSDFDFKL